MIFIFFALFCFVFAQSADSCNLKLKYSVSLSDSSGTPIAIESAELDEKRNAILLSTGSTNQVIRIDSNNGNVMDMPYIDNIPRARSSTVIGDLFFITSKNSVRVYDMSEDNENAPEYIDDIFPENTLSNHQYNGLCVSKDNNFLYVTDPGFVFGGPAAGPSQTGGVWKIDLSDYSSQEVVELGTRIQPNGCIVDNDGNLLFGARGDASTDPATPTSVMYIWDELNDEIILLKLNGLTFRVEGGSVDVDDNLFITENKIGKEIFQINLNDFVSCVLYNKPTNFCDPEQELELNRIEISLDNPADTGYDARKNYLLVPSFNTESVENFAVYKIRSC